MQFQLYVQQLGWSDAIVDKEDNYVDAVKGFVTYTGVEVGALQADSRRAFIKKQNETNCIGIHEDVLVPFHLLIKEFRVSLNQKGANVEKVKPR